MTLYYIRCLIAVVVGGLFRKYLGQRPKAWLAWAVPGLLGILLEFCLVESSFRSMAPLLLYLAAGALIMSFILKRHKEPEA